MLVQLLYKSSHVAAMVTCMDHLGSEALTHRTLQPHESAV